MISSHKPMQVRLVGIPLQNPYYDEGSVASYQQNINSFIKKGA